MVMLSGDVILRSAEGAPRDRTSLCSTDAVGKTADTACIVCTPIYLISTACSRMVPHAGFAAAQDDIVLWVATAALIISPTETLHPSIS
jgi:hypothetical protein